MKGIFNNTVKVQLLVLLSILGFVSCEHDDSLSGGDNETLRMFTPGMISSESFETEARLTWDPSLLSSDVSETYTAQVSEDSLFAGSSEIVLEKSTDTTGIVFTDQELQVRQDYFVRIKADAINQRGESKWSNSFRFSITGIQLLRPVYGPDVRDTNVQVTWDITEGINAFELQEFTQAETELEPTLIGEPFRVEVSTEEAAAGEKLIEGLNPNTRYMIDMYRGPLNVGYRTFTTRPTTIYNITLNPEDDLVEVINNSEDGDIIGLTPGTYDASSGSFEIYGKTITVASTSNNPNDTRILFNEFTLRDTGAGITLKGLELDGQTNALYLINLTSSNGNDDPADFTDVSIENCIVHNVATSAFRANRGPNSGYTMNSFSINYSIFYDFPPSNYGLLHLDELIFNEVSLRNSTFYEAGDLFIRFRQDLDNPAPDPRITIEYCTLNSLGSSQNYTLLDAGDVDVNFSITNSILSNIPRENSTVGESLMRLEGEGSTALISYNNFFNLTNGDPDEPEDLIIPEASYITLENIFEIDLGWGNTTTTFELPADSELQSAASSGGPIGDPRWWF